MGNRPPAAHGATRRDRHGRGLRGPVALPGPFAPDGVPVTPTRAERFDDIVLEAVEELEGRLADRLDGVEFAVEEVPLVGAAGSAPADGARSVLASSDVTGPEGLLDQVPLGTVVPGDREHPPRVVVYRRPLESRTTDAVELALIVHDVLVEQVSDLLGLPPEEVDPHYGDDLR